MTISTTIKTTALATILAVAASAAAALTVTPTLPVTSAFQDTAGSPVPTVSAAQAGSAFTFSWSGTGLTPNDNEVGAYIDFTISGVTAGKTAVLDFDLFTQGGNAATAVLFAVSADGGATWTKAAPQFRNQNCTPNRGRHGVAFREAYSAGCVAARVRNDNGGQLITGDRLGALDESLTYRLGFFEVGNPESGTMSFSISEVPLPASGLLLAGVFGGIAWRARRKAA